MSSDHLAWRSTGSTDRPISLTPRLSTSGFSLARAPDSVVQTGVKSFGSENNSAQLLPIQSWNLIFPSVVSASKSGAVAPIWRAIFDLMSFKLQMKFVCEYRAPDVSSEWLPQKDNILLRRSLSLECSFDRRPCNGKSTARPRAV